MKFWPLHDRVDAEEKTATDHHYTKWSGPPGVDY
jgi:hypothetical protein